MAAKKKSAKKNDSGNADDTPIGYGSDVIAAGLQAHSKTRFGVNCYSGHEDEARVFYLPVPLGLQILLQTEGLPMGKFITVVGPPGSCKSAFSFDLARIHRVFGGGYSVIETEDKLSVVLRKSIAGYSSKRCQSVYVELVEEWQEALERQISFVREAMDKDKPPKSRPWLFIVDSLSGAATQSVKDSIDEKGSAELVRPISANIINTYMKRLTHWFGLYPITVLGVNHLKMSTDKNGHDVRKIQGGEAPRFHESVEIEMRPIGGQGERRVPHRELFRRVQVTVAKNSFAQHPPKLQVEMCWRMVPSDPKDPSSPLIQRTVWDWYTCAIEHLTASETLSPQSKRQIDAALGLRRVRKKGRPDVVWSDILGIKEDSPVSLRAAGMILERRPELKEAVYAPLGIRRCFMFEPGKSLDKQRTEALTRVFSIDDDFGFDLGIDGGVKEGQEEPEA